MHPKWSSKFELKPGKWIFVPTAETVIEGRKIKLAIKKKWKQTSFAAGVHREQTELCEAKLGIKLDKFIGICLKSLQNINQDLGL